MIPSWLISITSFPANCQRNSMTRDRNINKRGPSDASIQTVSLSNVMEGDEKIEVVIAYMKNAIIGTAISNVKAAFS